VIAFLYSLVLFKLEEDEEGAAAADAADPDQAERLPDCVGSVARELAARGLARRTTEPRAADPMYR
jgi:hypothetical protein